MSLVDPVTFKLWKIKNMSVTFSVKQTQLCVRDGCSNLEVNRVGVCSVTCGYVGLGSH